MTSHTTTTTSSKEDVTRNTTTMEWLNIETLARIGYSIISSEWNMLGMGDTSATSTATATASSSSTIIDHTMIDIHHTIETSDMIQLQQRITAIFMARCVAILTPPQDGIYTDLSTQTICYTILKNIQKQKEENEDNNITNNTNNNETNNNTVPILLLQNNYKILVQLSEFIRRMMVGYKDVPYHNRKHAYHVVLSTTKLLDLMILSSSNTNTNTNTNTRSYGIKHDPIALFAQIFAALIHDVEHQGIPNRQLAIEDDRLAVLYNDQSMAENWSLYVAFSEFLQDEFVELRHVLFNQGTNNDNNNNNNDTVGGGGGGSVTQLQQQEQSIEYRRFRKLVINLVLSTDLASPERTQIGKSKWKEAFGDPYETLERKLREVAAATLAEQQQQQQNQNNNNNNNNNNRNHRPRRASLIQTTRLLTIGTTRRGSAISAMSSSPPPHPRDDDGIEIHNNNNNHYSNNTITTIQQVDGDVNVNVDDDDDDDSMSATPDQSEESDDDDDTNHNVTVAPKFLTDAATAVIIGDIHNQNSYGGNSSSSNNNNNMALRDKFERRMSASSVQSTKYRQRLGILRTVDLSGETIETYSRRGSMATTKSHQSNNNNNTTTNDNISMDESFTTTNYQNLLIADEPDELKATVVMETIMTAADVAHNLQSWNHMVKWSGRLYMELRRAHIAKRGFDPQEKWFENQIGFLESYLLPLARRLEDTGVFGDTTGQMFATIVEANRDRWLTNGFEETQKIIALGKKRYPPKN